MIDMICFCLFVCVLVRGFSSHSRIFHSLLKTHYYRWRATNFELCSALMAIEQWGFFNVPHQRCFDDLGLSRLGIEPRSPACEANALPLSHRGGLDVVCYVTVDVTRLIDVLTTWSEKVTFIYRWTFLKGVENNA